MELPSIGDLELDLLRFITDHPSITVRLVMEKFGNPRGLARTTILTVMERLRKKDFLKRDNKNGSFEYSSCIPKHDLMRRLTKSFTEKALGGSLDPLVAFLTHDAKLNEEQLNELRHLVETLDNKKEA